jgi:hypothetical protein
MYARILPHGARGFKCKRGRNDYPKRGAISNLPTKAYNAAQFL